MKKQNTNNTKQAVFLDRDGVVIEDNGLVTSFDQVKMFPEVPEVIKGFKNAGFQVVVISNQAVVARGMTDIAGVTGIHQRLNQDILEKSGVKIDEFYFCPHHPHANVPEYRVDCECRKPLPGMLLEAAKKHNIDLKSSFMIGDRMSDIIAGFKAGCKTILLKTGKHEDKPIISDHFDDSVRPDFVCNSLKEAYEIIKKETI